MGVNMVDENSKEASESSNAKFHSSTSASRLAIVPLRLFKSRSKSQNRVTSSAARSCWVPDGSCLWRDNAGHIVQLKDTNLLDIMEPERTALQRLAISRLNDLNLGCHVELPKTENDPVHHSKRRPMLLRKKAATTNFFEGKEKEKGLGGRGATMFGIPLSQCVANDRMRLADESVQRQDHCEEVLSALRISLKEEETSASSREGSQTDIRGPENQGSTESLTWLESSDCSDVSSQKRSASRGSTTSIYGSGGNQVPNIVDNCIAFLENKGLHTLGIFRVSGSKKRIRQLREDLDKNPKLTFNESIQPHDVAQLLKEFFRELPEPLLTRDLYKAFIEIQRLRDPQRRLEATRWLLYLLPVVHRDTLAALLSFLSRVADSSEDYHKSDGTWVNGNKMNSNNLATVFGPNILRSCKGSSETSFSVQSSEKAQDRSDVIITVKSLIDNHKALLQVPARELDSAYRNLLTEDPELLNALLYRHLNNSGTERKKQAEVESSSSHYHSETISDQSAMHITHRSAREIFFSKEMSYKQSHSSPELDVRSRIRPLMFPSTGYGDHSHLERAQRQETKLSLKTTQKSTVTEFTSHQYGVSASFTVTKASGGSSPVPELKIFESEQTSPLSKPARRVPYGKIRHMTTPSYVSEEMSITITIPTRKQMQRYQENEPQPLMYGGLSSWSGSQSNLIQNAQGLPKTDKRVQTKSKSSRQYLCPPAPQEIWKRQELIASEHTQL